MKTENIKSILLVVCVIVIWFNSCKSEIQTEPQEIIIKKTSGKATYDKPKQVVVTDQNKKEVVKGKNPVIINLTQKEKDAFELKINKLLKEKDSLDLIFMSANDSLHQIIYKQCNQINVFNDSLDNDDVLIKYYGLTKGTLETITIDWTVKQKKVPINEKEVVLRALIGGEIGLNKELNQGTYKFNLGLQNAKNDIIRGSYQKIGTNEYFLVGYDKSIFTIKKKKKVK